MPTTKTYTFTGGAQSLVVPAGVTSMAFDMWGGAGSSGDSFTVSLGARVQCTVPTTPGETLWFYVGGSGDQGGFNGGGRAGTTGMYGGGATDIRRGGFALSNRIIIAAGAGSAGATGSGAPGAGGAGGQPNGAAGVGGGERTAAGAGATQAGAGANGSSNPAGTSSGLGQGGSSAANFVTGGAGGGGLYGGGAGGSDFSSGNAFAAGGGGGGSSYSAVGGAIFGTALAESGRLVVTYNQPPSSPVLLSPANGQALNRDNTNRFSWQHVDPDGDGQQSGRLRHRQISASSWITTTIAGPQQFADFTAGTLAAGSYEWQVATRDFGTATDTWSPSLFFTAASPPPGPTIVFPVNGSTQSRASVAIGWTTSGDQDAYRVRSFADNAGARNEAVTYYDTGVIENAAISLVTVPLPVNSRYEHLAVEVKDNGLWSPISSVRILVSYTLPATALLSVEPVQTVASAYDFTDANAVTIVNPAPTVGQPQVAYRNVWCKATTDGDPYRPLDVPVRIATFVPSGVYLDQAAASDVDYVYAVEQVAVSGAVSMSEYVGDIRDLGETPGGGTPGDEGVFADAVFDPAVFG